jgi:hypothetical protein
VLVLLGAMLPWCAASSARAFSSCPGGTKNGLRGSHRAVAQPRRRLRCRTGLGNAVSAAAWAAAAASAVRRASEHEEGGANGVLHGNTGGTAKVA